MKTGLVILTTTDGSKSKVASKVLPLEAAKDAAKKIAATGDGADGFDCVEVWSGAMKRYALPKSEKTEEAAPAES